MTFGIEKIFTDLSVQRLYDGKRWYEAILQDDEGDFKNLKLRSYTYREHKEELKKAKKDRRHLKICLAH